MFDIEASRPQEIGSIKKIHNNSEKETVFGLRADLIICLFLVLITLTCYWQIKNHDFINYDDDVYVTENHNVQNGLTFESLSWAFTTNHGSNWHPLTWVSHMLDIELFGEKAGRHHLVNVLFHTANSLLLFFIIRRMTGAVWQSAFIAALFALHPLHVESVAWVAERKDVLSTFFWMLTIWAYVRYVERPWAGRYLPVVGFFVLGLMSKPMLVTLPFVLLLLDYWPLGRFQFGQPGIRRLVFEKVPLFSLSLASCVATYIAQHSGGAVISLTAYSLGVRIANALVVYTAYVGKMIWPSNMAVLYPFQPAIPLWKIAVAFLLLLAISWAAVKNIKKRPFFAVGWLWYLGTLVPVIGLVQVGLQSMADRYTYVPLIGLFIIISWGASEITAQWRYRHEILGAVSAGIILVLTSVTWFQIQYWDNSISLFERAIRVTQNNYVAHNNLGNSLEKLGRSDEAIGYFTKALKINPGYSEAHSNMGISLLSKGRLHEAIHHFSKALGINPFYAGAHNNLGVALTKLGRTEEAIRHYAEALRLKTDNAAAHYNLGVTLINQGRTEEAIKHLSEAIRINPDFVKARSALKTALLIQKRNMHNYK